MFRDRERLTKHLITLLLGYLGMMAALILSFCNGERGYRAKWFGRLYTAFHPAHMYVLGVIWLLCPQ